MAFKWWKVKNLPIYLLQFSRHVFRKVWTYQFIFPMNHLWLWNTISATHCKNAQNFGVLCGRIVVLTQASVKTLKFKKKPPNIFTNFWSTDFIGRIIQVRHLEREFEEKKKSDYTFCHHAWCDLSFYMSLLLFMNTVESPISGHHWCKSKVFANWKCPLIGNPCFSIQNLKYKDFLYLKYFYVWSLYSWV